MSPARSPLGRAGDLVARHGFYVVLAAVFLLFSFTTRSFATFANVLAMLHAMAPLVVMACGMALVVFSGKLDISIGSNAFLSCTAAVLLMRDHGAHWTVALAAALLCGALVGALNGFIVAVLQVNPLIATLGTMITLRGVSLQITKAVFIPVPEQVRLLGNATAGPVFLDIFVMAALAAAAHALHRRTVFGRQLNAIGNGEDVAERIGIPVRRTVFLSFVLTGLLAAFGGFVSLLQVGGLSGYLGRGMEFTAVAVIVVGGISLFGGRGAVLPGVLVGAFTFQVIQNGLNQLGANPYVYHVITGAIIFVAMYADALKAGRIQLVRRKVAAQQGREAVPHRSLHRRGAHRTEACMKALTRFVVVAAWLAAAALPAAAKEVTIGLSWNAIDNQLPVKWQEYMQNEAKTQGAAAGLEVKWVINVADADPTRQAANIEDLHQPGRGPHPGPRRGRRRHRLVHPGRQAGQDPLHHLRPASRPPPSPPRTWAATATTRPRPPPRPS